jgi:hypothetical protein
MVSEALALAVLVAEVPVWPVALGPSLVEFEDVLVSSDELLALRVVLSESVVPSELVSVSPPPQATQAGMSASVTIQVVLLIFPLPNETTRVDYTRRAVQSHGRFGTGATIVRAGERERRCAHLWLVCYRIHRCRTRSPAAGLDVEVRGKAGAGA